MFTRVIPVLLIVVLVLFFPVRPSLAVVTLTLTVTTNKPTYRFADTVYVSGGLFWLPNYFPATDGIVGVEVKESSGQPFIFRTVPTGPVSSQNWLVNFTEFYPCDWRGIPKYSFQAREAVYVHAAWRNFDTILAHTVEYAVNIYDANSIPLGIFLFSIILAPNSAESPIEFMASMIPASTVGNVTLYASLFSDLPENGGYPYCPELNATFTIATPTNNPPFESSSGGTYNFSFKLPTGGIPVGNYTVYANTNYYAIGTYYYVASNATFAIILQGDINGDGVVDIYDAIQMAKAFNTAPGNPKWNPNADLNHDGFVDIYDAIILANNFGKGG
ncbi:MAG: dockerin type I domain-containing protein [Candidatus Bathyarchaeia archaeon]